MNIADVLLTWDTLLYATASLAGWWCIAGVRILPCGSGSRSPIAVVIPARNEGHNIGGVVTSIAHQLTEGDEIVVVDDHSTDNTIEVARHAGARVVSAPPLPEEWMGKAHACWVGATATAAETMIFVDADVRLVGHDVISRLIHVVEAHPAALVSVQPWHEPGAMLERLAALFNVVALMGSGAGRVTGSHGQALAFGPVLACRRERYLALGGHAHALVRGSVIEDVALGKRFGQTEVFIGDATSISFRMYPHGFRSMLDGFTKNIAQGLRSTNMINSIAASAWIAAMVGAVFTSPLLYVASVVQVALAQRRVGRFGFVTAVAYPLTALIFVVVVVRSALVGLGVGRVSWAGRRLP